MRLIIRKLNVTPLSYNIYTLRLPKIRTMAPKRAKKRTIIPVSKPYQVNDLILREIRAVDKASDWLISNLSTIINNYSPQAR